MKHPLRVLAVVALVFFWMTPRAHALEIEDIVKMSSFGVADTVIISAIEASDTVFSLTSDQIIELTRAGVSQQVIEAMQRTGRRESPSPRLEPPGDASRPDAAAPPAPPPESRPAPARTTRPQPSPRRPVEPTQRLRPQIDRERPQEVLDFKRNYDLGKYVNTAFDTYALLSGRDRERFAEFRQETLLYLGRSLKKLELYHSAHLLFLDLARKGPEGPYFVSALSNLTRTSEKLKAYDNLTEVAQAVPSTDLPRLIRNTERYLTGRAQYERDDFEDARVTLQVVSETSMFYPRAQFITGLAQYRMGRKRDAYETFKGLAQAKLLVGQEDEIRDVQDLSVLNIARIFYGEEFYDRAEIVYGQVRRESRFWPQALYESAYVSFWKEDYNKALGDLLTISSPFFDDTVFLPEAAILEALIYYNLCSYDRVERIIRRFQAEIKPVRDNIRAFRGRYSVVWNEEAASRLDPRIREKQATQEALEAFTTAYHSSTGRADLQIPDQVFVDVENRQRFRDSLHHLGMIRKEMERLHSGRTNWDETDLGKTLLKGLERDEGRLRADAGRELLKELGRVERDLSDMLGQSDIIRFEVVNAQKRDYEDKFRNPENIDTYDDLEQSYATQSTLIYWPFTREFWQDELGYYRFTERGDCRADQEGNQGTGTTP